MKHNFRTISAVSLVMLLTALAFGQPVTPRAVTPEQSGDESAVAGKNNDAIISYKQQWQSCHVPEGDGNAECEIVRDRLTTKMGAALGKLPTQPAVMDDAEYHAAKGLAFIKGAKTPADFAKAVKEFQDAVNLAPWMYDYQFNLAVALKSAGEFKTALSYCKYARNLAQSEKDRRDTTALRAEIDATSDMAASAAADKQATALKAEQAARSNRFAGRWKNAAILMELRSDGDSCSILHSETGIPSVPLIAESCTISDQKAVISLVDARHNYRIVCEFVPQSDGSLSSRRLSGGWDEGHQKVIEWGCDRLVRP